MKFLFFFLIVISGTKAELNVESLLEEGNDLFQKANELTVDDPEKAKDLYLKSALRFERITRDGEVENGKIYYNIGNAYFRADDLGRAILNYRRAEQFTPNDHNIQQNLSYARKRRKDALGETEETKVLQTLLFWHYDFSFSQRFTFFVTVFLTFWTAAATLIFLKRPFLKWIMGTTAILSVVFGVSLVTESRTIQSKRPGVIISDEIIARKGDSESYEASFQEPLHAGTEFTLIENRQNWLHIELIDGRQCWLPEVAISMVR